MADPFAALMSMSFSFPLRPAVELSLVEKLVLLAGDLYLGEPAPDAALLKECRSKFRRARALANNRGEMGGGEMGIEWEPTFRVMGLERVIYEPTTLAGVDFKTLTPVELFLIAAGLVASITHVSDEEKEEAVERLEILRDAVPRRTVVPSQLPSPRVESSAPPTTAAVSNAVAGSSTFRQPLSTFAPFSLASAVPHSTFPPPPLHKRLPSDRPFSSNTEEQPSAVSTAWLDDVRASTMANGYDRVVPLATDLDIIGTSKRGRSDEDSEDWPSRNERNRSAVLRTQLGSTDEFTEPNGDRVAHGIPDPRRPTSRIESYIPKDLADRLHTLYVNYYPAHFTLGDLSDLLTLPGHSPPVALRSIYARRRQMEEKSGKRTKYAFLAFESKTTKEAVIRAMNHHKIDGEESYMIRVEYLRVASSGWQWNAFSEEFMEDYDSERNRKQRRSRPLRSSPPLAHPVPRPAVIAPSKGSLVLQQQGTLDGAKAIYVPHDLMLEFPQVQIYGLPLNSTLTASWNLLDCFSEKVDPSSMLGIFVSDKVTSYVTIPAWIVFDTWDSRHAFRKGFHGVKLPGATEKLAVTDIVPSRNRRLWKWTTMSKAFVRHFAPVHRDGKGPSPFSSTDAFLRPPPASSSTDQPFVKSGSNSNDVVASEPSSPRFESPSPTIAP